MLRNSGVGCWQLRIFCVNALQANREVLGEGGSSPAFGYAGKMLRCALALNTGKPHRLG